MYRSGALCLEPPVPEARFTREHRKGRRARRSIHETLNLAPANHSLSKQPFCIGLLLAPSDAASPPSMQMISASGREQLAPLNARVDVPLRLWRDSDHCPGLQAVFSDRRLIKIEAETWSLWKN